MKHLKMFVVAAVAAAAMTAVVGVGSASATVLCKNNASTSACSEKYAAGTMVDLSLSGSMIHETTGGTTLYTCSGTTWQGKTASGGSSSETIRIPLEMVSWMGCTKHTTTLVKGELEIHHIPGTDNGTVTWKNTQITIGGLFNNESCIYGGGAGTDLGTLSGGSPATLSVNALIQRQAGSGPFCPVETRWTMGLTATAPKPLYVAAG